MYEYRAQVLDVVDGDTVRLAVDLGCDVTIKLTIRLAGINCPERGTIEGGEASDFTVRWLSDATSFGRQVTLQTFKDKREKYGRYLGRIYDDVGVTLNDSLIANGHAVRYMA